MALQKGVHMWERIRLNTYDFKDGQWIRQENFCEFQIEEMIGEGTFCWTYRARKGNVVGKTVALKEIKRADGMTAKEYERTAQDYLADIWNYKKAMEAAQREVLSVNAIYIEKDENIFIEQDYLDGVLYSKFRFEQFDLEKELVLFKKLLHFLKALHQQNLFVLDLKQENFMVITGNNEPELVYFDLYLYNGEEKGGGEKCYPEGKRSYVEKYLRKNEFQRVDLILSILVLYERLNQTEELPKSKANIKIPDERNRVQKKIREIFIKGWDGEYECCDDLEKDIDDLEELLKEAPVPELLTERDRFVPRENACKEIEKILKCSDGRRHICVITGEGGSGKSELAREYSRYAKNNSDVTYTDIYWLTCPEGADAAVDELMETVGIGKEDAVSLTVSKLLIFDNCNFNKFSFNRDLYEKTGAAHVIVTSRVQSLNGVSGDTLYLEKYQTEEFAMRVFRKNCESSLIGNSVQIPETYQEMIKKLIRQISCNTLLAAMLGIALRDYLHLGETEFCEHLQMISNSIHKCLEDEPEIHLNRKLYGDEVVQDIADGDENIGSILQIVFSDELLGRYSETEYKILTLLKVCPNRFINKDFILKLAVDTDQTPIKKQRIINRLVNDNWIKYGEINGEKEITMHPIVALAIKDRAFIDQKIEGFYNELLTKIVSLKINEPEYAEENRMYVSTLIRNFENKMEDKLALSLTAYEYGDFSLADCIIKSKYKNNLQKPIAFMKGFGTKKKNYAYLIAYDGEKVLDFSTINIPNNTEMKGKIVWCWDNYVYDEKSNFEFGAIVKCKHGDVIDIIEITEIAARCFWGNKHIGYYDFKQSLNEVTGKTVEIEKIGEEAFLGSEVERFSCESEAIDRIEIREFYKCPNLLKVNFNRSRLRVLKTACFYGCTNLRELFFDNRNKIKIEAQAFFNCRELSNIANNKLIINKIEDMAFYLCQKIKIYIEIEAEKISREAFYGCEKIENIQIGMKTKYIGVNAFGKCKRIKHIDLLDTIEKIDMEAFGGCALRNVELNGEGKIKIDKTSFVTRGIPIEDFSMNLYNGQVEFSHDNNYFVKEPVIEVNHTLNLKNVNLCKNLFWINGNVKINIGEGVKVCGKVIDRRNIKELESVFWVKNVKEMEIHPHFRYLNDVEKNIVCCPSVSTMIGELKKVKKNKKLLKWSEKKYESMEYVNIKHSGESICASQYTFSYILEISGEKVVRIEKSGLEYCEKLKSICFPKLKYIEAYAMYGCIKLKSVEIPQVIKIEKGGFSQCCSLERIEIPNIEKIGDGTFERCESLKEIEIKKLEKISDGTFQDCISLEKVVVGDNLKEIGKYAFNGCRKLKKLSVEGSRETLLECIELPKTLNTLEEYVFADTPITNVKLNGHVNVKEGAFSMCRNLSCINWDDVDSISAFAFEKCHFSNIHLNKKITSIPRMAFANNAYLEKIRFRNNKVYVDGYAFYGCWLLKDMHTHCVKYLGEYALGFSSLEVIVFQNIYNIGEKCFINSQKLKYVFIKCMEEKMVIGNKVFDGCISLREIWIDHDGIDDIDESAFPYGVSIYVIRGSSVEKKLFDRGYMLCPVSIDEMGKEWNHVKDIIEY